MSLLIILSGLFAFQAFAVNEGLRFHKASLNHQKSMARNLRIDGSFRIMDKSLFDQKFDHSKPSSTKTFKQRYFVDSHYAQNNNSPVFYIICGEWNCAGTGSYSSVEAMAKKFKAHLVALEHRFYGESLPTTKLTTANLKTLTLESAIEDLATFQKFMMEEKGLQGKWISVGGSYAGTLSAFYRLKHPELVVGAIASSAPVLMKPEFFEYDAHVAKVINKSICGDKVREAVSLIEAKMKTPSGVAEVKKLFKADEVKNDDDFLYVVADMLAAAVQYGMDANFCKILTNSDDLVAGYAKAGVSTLNSMGSTPLEISMQSAEKVDITSEDYFRQWMWQSCNEFGWFQVANGAGSETSRSSRIDLDYHAKVCQRLYKTAMKADGSMNNEWYYTLFNPSVSQIIFTNGGNDPWLTLSVIEGNRDTNASFDLLMMDGAAHCNDLATGRLTSVIAAQSKMTAIVSGWLAL